MSVITHKITDFKVSLQHLSRWRKKCLCLSVQLCILHRSNEAKWTIS